MQTISTLKRISVAVATLAAVVAAVLFGLQGQTDAAASRPNVPAPVDTTTTSSPETVQPATTPPETATPETTQSPTAAPPTTGAPEPAPEPEAEVAPSGTLRPGDKGAAVLALQERLRALGYWLGTADGTYGGLTVQAVMAFQKVEGMDRDGIAGGATLAALEHASRPQPASTTGDLIEIDKDRQVLFVVRDGQVAWTLNVSTGTEEPYWVNGRTELADTPAGQWKVAWVYDGVDVGELGGLYRPRYFHADGIAVHGYSDVPSFPASHGCVRVSNAAMDWIWSTGLMPIGSPVWVY